MLLKPPMSKITTLVTLTHIDIFTHDTCREAYTKDEDYKEVFSSCRARFMCMMVIAQLINISEINYSTCWISYVFLNVGDYN